MFAKCDGRVAFFGPEGDADLVADQCHHCVDGAESFVGKMEPDRPAGHAGGPSRAFASDAHAQSVEAQAHLQSFTEEDMQRCQRDVLVQRFGGSPDTVDPAKQKRSAGKKKTPTHETTLAMLNDNIPLPEIAQQRKLTLSTILGHLEKLKGQDMLPDITYLKPSSPDSEFERVIEAFHDSEDGRLTPVHRKFGGRYSFEDLRIARLLAW